jgi:hypothetical protein
MKKIILFVCFFTTMISCEKANIQPLPISNKIAGKWASISQFLDGEWKMIPQMHFFEFMTDGTFTFRDHNGLPCTGTYVFTEALNESYIDFNQQQCGLTRRKAFMNPGTLHEILEMEFLNPVLPVSLPQKIRYVRIQ